MQRRATPPDVNLVILMAVFYVLYLLLGHYLTLIFRRYRRKNTRFLCPACMFRCNLRSAPHCYCRIFFSLDRCFSHCIHGLTDGSNIRSTFVVCCRQHCFTGTQALYFRCRAPVANHEPATKTKSRKNDNDYRCDRWTADHLCLPVKIAESGRKKTRTGRAGTKTTRRSGTKNRRAGLGKYLAVMRIRQK